MSAFFFFNDTATTEIYTSFPTRRSSDLLRGENTGQIVWSELGPKRLEESRPADGWDSDRRRARCALRSEEHTSELQSQSNLVCRLLLEKKKRTHTLHSEVAEYSLVWQVS